MSPRVIYSSIGVWSAIVTAVTGFGMLSGMSITIGTAVLVLAAAAELSKGVNVGYCIDGPGLDQAARG